MGKQITEAEFEEMVDGLGMTNEVKAVMRKSLGLPYDPTLIPKHEVLEKKALLQGWAMLPDRAPK